MTIKTNTINNIAVIGAGYVGLSNAILLSQDYLHTQVTLFDINHERIAKLQQRISPLQDEVIIDFLANRKLNFMATDDATDIYKNVDVVIIATPTNYDIASGMFDTSSVEASIRAVREQNHNVLIVIKSTIPIGFTQKIQANTSEEWNDNWDDNIVFMPEFLREGQALYDNLHPSRIIVGSSITQSVDEVDVIDNLMDLYKQASEKKDVECLRMPTTEAEAVKLFANSYLATRIAFFNELDSFAESHKIDSQSIITGIGLDPRIGEHYNNPSFGYGGYCLPKDTQQLKANYHGIPANVVHAVVDSNNTRKRFIARQIIEKNPKSVGIYRLSMKKNADNFRDSAVLDIINILIQHGLTVTIYEPALKGFGQDIFESCPVINDINTFRQANDLIVANRWHDDLNTVAKKVYTRDVFGYS